MHVYGVTPSALAGYVTYALLGRLNCTHFPSTLGLAHQTAPPYDTGTTAGYEMHRTRNYNSFLYEPLGADRPQQREGLVGMTIAEGTSIAPYAAREPWLEMHSHGVVAVDAQRT